MSPIVSLLIVFVLLANSFGNILWQIVLLANSFANSFVPNCLLFPLSLKADQGKTLFSARNFSLVTWISNSKSQNLDFNWISKLGFQQSRAFQKFPPRVETFTILGFNRARWGDITLKLSNIFLWDLSHSRQLQITHLCKSSYLCIFSLFGWFGWF